MPAVANSRFLDLGALTALEHMRFSTRHRVEGNYSGRHRSRQMGGAGEFVDYREYSGGEDLRRLDWKVLARTGRAYVRLHQEETKLLCTLAMDVSESMRFGGFGRPRDAGSKLEYMQYLATALSHIIVHGQDQVGLALLDGTLREVASPGGTPSHLARVHALIEELSTTRGTELAPALRSLFEQSRTRGVLLLLSDFLIDDLEATFAAVRLFHHRGWEVPVLHLVHPDEEQLPEGAAFRFEGMEETLSLACAPADIRTLYRQRFQAHAARVRGLAMAAGCDYRYVSTAVPYLETLGGFLVERVG